ncbi:Inner membrane ABC transporter permease protein ycjO [uncultured Ruminococcus sp.]|nr:Inner membrane ABC transporter permease protein ycjO [uncultured Ruminococcus sp.]SCH30503.1 Inner membrane ABC transporter permease protein ycjO [uncultured Clostridium sp.]
MNAATPFWNNRRKRSCADAATSIVFIIPTAILLIAFVIIPIIWTVQISFNEWDGLQPTMNFVGLENYQTAFQKPQFQKSLLNNFIWAVMHLFFACGTGFFIAFLISRLKRGMGFFRTVLFLPNVIATTISAVMWTQIFNPTYGILNNLLSAIGLDSLALQWLADPDLVIYSTSMASCWQAYGYYMVLFLAGLQNIDVSLYEAARMDGANAFKQFIHVTIPGLRSILTFVISMALINGLKGFATVWAMTRGGPEYSSHLLSLFVYKTAFLEYDYGLASAAAVILGILVMVITIAFNVFSDKINADM